MPNSISRRVVLGGMAATAGAGIVGVPAVAAPPSTMQWTAADVGSAGYTEASAFANALIKKHGARVRVVPSGTSIGRMLQMRQGRVNMGFMANEVYFATEALHDFAVREWGPQDLRVMYGRKAAFSIVTAKSEGIKTIADLKGRRVARIQSHPSVNTKMGGILAFAGLTWDDVEQVIVPSYGAGLRAVIDGTVAAAGATVGASLLRELEASSRGIYWPEIPADDAEGWARMDAAAPLFSPITLTSGPGIEAGQSVGLVAYRYPMLTVYKGADEQEVYEVTKAMIESYDLYKDASATMALWEVNKAAHTPYDAPVHNGAKRYLEEIGVWTEADETWNAARIKRLGKVMEVWDAATEEADAQQMPDKKWVGFWNEFRAENL